MGRWEAMQPYMKKKWNHIDSPKTLKFISPKQQNKYRAQVHKSKGFDVDDCPGIMCGKITPIPKNCRQWEFSQKLAQFAALASVEQLEHPPLKPVRLIKTNQQAVAGLLYYLTFRGTDASWVESTYQAKVWHKPGSEFETCFFEKIPGSEVQRNPKIERVLSIVKNWKAKNAQVGRKRKTPGASAFFAYVRSIMIDNPDMTFAQARSQGSSLWKDGLTDLEKRTFASAASKNPKKRSRRIT